MMALVGETELYMQNCLLSCNRIISPLKLKTMNKQTIAVLLFSFVFLSAKSQTRTTGGSSIKIKPNLPYGRNTYKRLVLPDGTYPIFKSPSGRLYINRISKIGEVNVEYIN